MFATEKRAKLAARSLERFLAGLGIELKHGQALDALAASEGYSHWGAMRKAIEASAAKVGLAPVHTPRLVRMPSCDDGSYDRYAIAPDDMDYMDALRFANQVIAAVNFEDHEREECLDGSSVEDNIQRRLEARGFVFPNIDSTEDCWDEYSPKSLAEPEDWPAIRAHFGVPEDLSIPNEEKHIYAWKFHGAGGELEGKRQESSDIVLLHVWQATLYLDGQSVIGEPRVAMRLDKRDIREAMFDEYWDARLDAGDATPVLHIEQLDDGRYVGPYRVEFEDGGESLFDTLADAIDLAYSGPGGAPLTCTVYGEEGGDEVEIVSFREGGPRLL